MTEEQRSPPVWKQLRPGWRSARHAQLWLASVEHHAFPYIGKMPIAEVTSADVIGILAPIWHEKASTARKLRQRIRAVLEWAVAMDLQPDNPCDRIGPVLGAQGNAVRHMRALPHGEVGAALRAVRGSKARPVVKLAFEFLVLTATRSSEVRAAAWKEVNRDEGVWTIPARRTKGNREHRVPLSRRAVEILDQARALGGGGPFVFPSLHGKPLGSTAMADLLRALRIAAVPHGFRSSFRDWAAEETDHPREVAEAALAHKVRNPIEAAYRRTDLFERRRRLMEDWAGYLAGESRQPAAEGRSFQVVIDGERTWQSQRLLEARFGSVSRGSRGRSGSVSETSGVTYIRRAFHLTQANSPISLSCLWLRPDSRTPAPALGKRRWTGAPPLFAARSGRGGAAQFTFAQHPLGGSLPSQLSLQEGPEEDH